MPGWEATKHLYHLHHPGSWLAGMKWIWCLEAPFGTEHVLPQLSGVVPATNSYLSPSPERELAPSVSALGSMTS